jgi:predicted DNA-binding protein YlxM (UPF0122 family)
MGKNTIKINGKKLKLLIEDDLNMSIYEIATDNGYSRNLIAQAIRTGKASPVVQTLLRIYNIKPEEYEIKDPEPPKKGQMSFDDIEEIKRAELKSLIKETILETLEDFICKGINSYYDPVNKIYTINIKIK